MINTFSCTQDTSRHTAISSSFAGVRRQLANCGLARSDSRQRQRIARQDIAGSVGHELQPSASKGGTAHQSSGQQSGPPPSWFPFGIGRSVHATRSKEDKSQTDDMQSDDTILVRVPRIRSTLPYRNERNITLQTTERQQHAFSHLHPIKGGGTRESSVVRNLHCKFITLLASRAGMTRMMAAYKTAPWEVSMDPRQTLHGWKGSLPAPAVRGFSYTSRTYQPIRFHFSSRVYALRPTRITRRCWTTSTPHPCGLDCSLDCSLELHPHGDPLIPLLIVQEAFPKRCEVPYV